MKIIEAMKEIKRLEEKAVDLQSKVARYCADLDFETPTYTDQRATVTGWLQSVHDSLKEAARLRIAIQKTNLSTIVPIELGGNKVEHSIAEWIIRRRLYADLERKTYEYLTDRNLKEGSGKNSTGDPVVVKVRRYYDPLDRDKKVEIYRSEPGIIDRTLEVINATTDIMN